MKRLFSYIALIGCITLGHAQDELNKVFKPIPPKNTSIKKIEPSKKSTPKNALAQVAPPKKDSLYLDPKALYKDYNIYKKEENTDGIFYRRNQFLGNFKTQAIVSSIQFKDAAFVDGDKIKVYLNDKLIEPEVTLDSEAKTIKINLVKGINKIDFEALNEGSASPNTAELKVFDDKGVIISSSQWNVGTGYKATIVLIKE